MIARTAEGNGIDRPTFWQWIELGKEARACDVDACCDPHHGPRDAALNQWGEYVDQDLAEILQSLDAGGANIGLLGFSSDEVERLLSLVGVGADADDEDFDPTPPAVPELSPGNKAERIAHG